MKQQFKKYINRYRYDSLIKGFSFLFSGTAITQIVTLFLAPILTRLYTPVEFGINSIFISILTIFGVVVTLRLNIAISITKVKSDKLFLSRICIFFSTIFSIILFIVVLSFGNSITAIFDIEKTDWLLILPLSIFLLGIYEILLQNLLSQNSYKLMAKITVIKIVTQGVFQILFSFFDLGYLGLILGNLISILTGVVVMFIKLRIKGLYKVFNINQHKSIIKKYSKFPKYAFPAEIASIASYSVIPLIITFLYTVEVTGYFSLANRLIGIPIGLFGNSLRLVYIREATKELTVSGTVKKSFLRTSKILVVIAIPSAIGIYILGPQFFEIVFGEAWATSGVFVRALILLFISRIIVTPLISTVNIIGKQQIGLIINVALLTGLVILTLVYKYLEVTNPTSFLIVLSIQLSFIYLIAYMVLYKIVKK